MAEWGKWKLSGEDPSPSNFLKSKQLLIIALTKVLPLEILNVLNYL